MIKVDIVYITTGGNTLLVVQAIQDMLLEHNSANDISVTLTTASQAIAADVAQADIVLLASPTYGHGLLDKEMTTFLDQLAAIDATQLQKLSGATIGLGDAMYDADYHIESAKIMQQFLQENGISVIHRPLLITGSPIEQLDTVVARWVKKLNTVIVEQD